MRGCVIEYVKVDLRGTRSQPDIGVAHVDHLNWTSCTDLDEVKTHIQEMLGSLPRHKSISPTDPITLMSVRRTIDSTTGTITASRHVCLNAIDILH